MLPNKKYQPLQENTEVITYFLLLLDTNYLCEKYNLNYISSITDLSFAKET